MQNHHDWAGFGTSTTWKIYFFWVRSIIVYCSMAATHFRIVAPDFCLARYYQCVQSWTPGWIAMLCWKIFICKKCPLHTEQCLEITTRTAWLRLTKTRMSLREFYESFKLFSGVAKNSTYGKLGASFFLLPVVRRSFSALRASCAINFLLKRYEGLISADRTTWLV